MPRPTARAVAPFPALQPARAIRDTGIAAVVLMDGQIDHTTGLLMLREGGSLWAVVHRQVREDLTRGNPVFSVLGTYCGVDWHPVRRPATAAVRRRRLDGLELSPRCR